MTVRELLESRGFRVFKTVGCEFVCYTPEGDEPGTSDIDRMPEMLDLLEGQGYHDYEPIALGRGAYVMGDPDELCDPEVPVARRESGQTGVVYLLTCGRQWEGASTYRVFGTLLSACEAAKELGSTPLVERTGVYAGLGVGSARRWRGSGRDRFDWRERMDVYAGSARRWQGSGRDGARFDWLWVTEVEVEG